MSLLRSGAGWSGHSLGIAAAITLGRALGRLPARLVVVAVEGRSFGVGIPMSPEVRAAVPGAVVQVLGTLRGLG